MKNINEKWVRYDKRIAGNVYDEDLYPDSKKGSLKKMMSKLNKLFMTGKRNVNEDLRRWFKEKWVDISRKDESGNYAPCGRSKSKKKKYPKCRPSIRVSSETPETSGEMTREEKIKAIRLKRKAEKKKRKGKKPHMTSHLKEAVEILLEKNIPTKPKLWSRAKALARKKFKVYPSAYANGWAAKWYKKHGGGWQSGG
jgi:hypothetical protein